MFKFWKQRKCTTNKHENCYVLVTLFTLSTSTFSYRLFKTVYSQQSTTVNGSFLFVPVHLTFKVHILKARDEETFIPVTRFINDLINIKISGDIAFLHHSATHSATHGHLRCRILFHLIGNHTLGGRNIPAIDAAFSSDTRATLAGSITPVSSRLTYWSVRTL